MEYVPIAERMAVCIDSMRRPGRSPLRKKIAERNVSGTTCKHSQYIDFDATTKNLFSWPGVRQERAEKLLLSVVYMQHPLSLNF